MHPPPCGLLGGTAPLRRRQRDFLAANHCCLFVTRVIMTSLRLWIYLGFLNRQVLLSRKSFVMELSAVWITRYLLGVVLPVMLFAFHKDEILFTQNNACRWLFVGWLLCWYSSGLGLSFKHNVETIRFRQICLSFHICSEGTALDCFMWADTRVLHFLHSPLWYSHSSFGVLLLSLDLYLHSFRKTPNSLQEMQHWNIFSTVNIPHLIVRVHIVWYSAIERWNVSDFPLPWPMFLFWLNASQQQKWNSVLFRGYTDIDNIF